MESPDSQITVTIDEGLGIETTYFPSGSLKNNYLNPDSLSFFRRPPILVGNWWRTKCKKCCMTSVQIVIPLVYIVYMICAVYYEPQRADLLLLDFGVLSIWLYVFTKQPKQILHRAEKLVEDLLLHIKKLWKCKFKFFRPIITIVLSLFLLGFLAFDWYYDKEKLIPFGGLVCLLLIVYISSRSPSKVEWTPVIWGVILQVVLGLIILRWPVGYSVCKFIGDQVAAFLAYTDNGSRFVFGDQGLIDHPVIFKILPVVVFFGAIINILYYWGAMQVIIKAIANVLKFTMKTSPLESFATSAHIFVGQVESSIPLKPFLKDISRSELHAVMTGGFATVAGTVIGAYIEFGVPANHLIAASFMSAPAALAVAKLGWPEHKESQSINMDNIQLNVGNETSLMEAASAGATSTIKLISYVVVNLIAILAILSFVDAIISFYGDRVGHPEISFEWLCSYIFMPLAVIMGIPWKDCRIVATLIGKKIILNEFLAYIDLGKLIQEGKIEGRTGVIATYILCGFGSLAAMGINLGALTAAEPCRRKDYARGIFRAFVCGNVACFMTACIAGMLYIEPIQTFTNRTDLNAKFSNTTFNDSFIFAKNSSVLGNTG